MFKLYKYNTCCCLSQTTSIIVEQPRATCKIQRSKCSDCSRLSKLANTLVISSYEERRAVASVTQFMRHRSNCHSATVHKLVSRALDRLIDHAFVRVQFQPFLAWEHSFKCHD
jgi:hypothetical protein